jgi:ornithine cyclodeaminase
MKIYRLAEIKQHLDIPSVMAGMEEGFVALCKKETVTPPVGLLHFDDPKGDCHIKYGYIKSGNYYVVKIASGFYDNPRKGLPTGNGMMILFDKATGTPVCILLDEGYLTDVRTGLAGSIAARYLAPSKVDCIGIVGTGAQAFFQLKYLTLVTSCRKVLVWGRNHEKALALKRHENLGEFQIEVAPNIETIASKCNLIVTTTNTETPLLFHHHIRPGTHITAIGADDVGKQEIHSALFAHADRIVVDSKNQAMLFGDTFYALKSGLIEKDAIRELGEVIEDKKLRRQNDEQITIADLTGVAVSDLQIAVKIYENMTLGKP